MASTTAEYNSTAYIKGSRRHPMAAATRVHVGNLMIINTTTGMASAGASAATSRCVGRCAGTVDNSAGAAGDLHVVAVQGVYSYENSATSPLGIGDIGLPVYIEDPKTVAKTIGSNPVAAGILIGFDGLKVLVDQTAL